MKKNMGLIDRIIRTGLAIVIVLLFFAGKVTGVAAVLLGAIAVIFIVTSTISFCPLYVPLKINTSKEGK